MKKLLILLAILTSSLSFSQGTIQITHEQAKEAIKTKQRVQVLEIAIRQQKIAIDKLQVQVSDLKLQVTDSELQNALWEENYNRLKVQFEALQKIKDPGYSWKEFKNDLLLFGAGAVAAVVAIISL